MATLGYGGRPRWSDSGAVYLFVTKPQLARFQNDYEQAYRLYEESLNIFKELGDRQGIARSLLNLGLVTTAQGDYEQARRLHEESLNIRIELGDKGGMAYSLEGFAEVFLKQAKKEKAVSLWGAADSIRQNIGVPLPLKEQEQYQEQVALVRSALGEIAFAAAWEEGRSMTWEQAVAYALDTA